MVPVQLFTVKSDDYLNLVPEQPHGRKVELTSTNGPTFTHA